MSAFYIWNPYTAPANPKVLDFMLTNGDVAGIPQDEKFIQSVLKDIGVEASVKSWTIKVYRTNYYSDYLGEEDWRDIWQPVWKLHVVTDEEIRALPKRKTPWMGTNATGKNLLDRPDRNAIISCLVISDFKSEAALRKAQSALTNADFKQLQAQYSAGEPQFSRSEVLGKYKQLQIDLGEFGEEFYASRADYAEQVIEICKNAKGIVHYKTHPEK
jgi:hypothetical protein